MRTQDKAINAETTVDHLPAFKLAALVADLVDDVLAAVVVTPGAPPLACVPTAVALPLAVA